ncbi:MAG: ATP-binding cassette domain-containing protein, partial [Treponema sp.]|nr:ATP-binding cassette domain-containing protein [Treponema sp.]
YNNGEVVTFDKHISFNNPGIYYLSAKSGFGKSTIFKLMTKTLFSNETDIVFDNNNINSIPENVFFDKVTYLDGSPTFIQGSIMDNITFFGKYDFNENHLSEIFDESENILPNRELNIGEGVALSNGQLQRINILRLFAKGTAQKLIILDEAISGVEEECEQKIIKLLKSTFNESIIILVTHRKSSEFLCDYTIDLAD